jgi:hypothetical protein
MVVNSESHAWLSSAVRPDELVGHKHKPDLFLCHPGNVFIISLCVDPDLQTVNDAPVGEPADMKLCSDVWVADCKIVADNTALGECLDHMSLVAMHANINQISGMLFSKDFVYLLKVTLFHLVKQRLHIDQRIRIGWTRVFFRSVFFCSDSF